MQDYYLKISSDFEYSTGSDIPSEGGRVGTSICGRFNIFLNGDTGIANELVSDILGKRVTGNYIIGLIGGNGLRGFCTEQMAIEYMFYVVNLYNSKSTGMDSFSNLG